MRLAGLTGGIACGKSTVTRMLREEQITVIDSDAIAQETTQKVQGWHTFVHLIQQITALSSKSCRPLHRRERRREALPNVLYHMCAGALGLSSRRQGFWTWHPDAGWWVLYTSDMHNVSPLVASHALRCA